MIDFYEGWELRNRLIADGYLTSDDNMENGHDMAMKIYELAREHYGWKPAEPICNPKPSKEYAEYLEKMTPTSRLDHIYGIAIDWDGFRTIRGIGGLVDEIISCTIPPCISEHEVLEQVKLTKMFKDIPDFLNTRVTEDKIPFTWNFDNDDVGEVTKWCKGHGYLCEINTFNRAADGEMIGVPITIKKGTQNDFI